MSEGPDNQRRGTRAYAALWTLIPVSAGVAGAVAILVWLTSGSPVNVDLRVPVERPKASAGTATQAPKNPGTLTKGPATPREEPGAWPQFRGPFRTGVADAAEKLLRAWPESGPERLWEIEVGEGHAGAVILKGRVYLIDYDTKRHEDAIRCLSFQDGSEVWRFGYSVKVKRNHGMSRTVPAVDDRWVVTLGPKCHVFCLSAKTGELLWKKDLVREFGATVPPWYAGQCPLIEGDNVILAPGGDPLMMAVDGATGRIVWRTSNPGAWAMTHCSIMPMVLGGVRQYVYGATEGVVGVEAETGRILWKTSAWKVPVAAIASPVDVGEGRVLLSGGYGYGSMMLQVTASGGAFTTRELWRLRPSVFGSPQHTPIFYRGQVYAVIPNGQFVCLGLLGKQWWRSGPKVRFELGPYLIADGLILALDGRTGTLRLAEATPKGYTELASADVLKGHDCWGPMALANGKLLVRDLTRMVCLRVGKERPWPRKAKSAPKEEETVFE